MDYYEYDEELVGEAPCEFCGELYPLSLLIQHQTIHLDGEYQGFDNMQDFNEGEDICIVNEILPNSNEVEEIIPQVEAINIEQKETEQIQKQSSVTEPKVTVQQIQTQRPKMEQEILDDEIHIQLQQFNEQPQKKSAKTTANEQKEKKKYQTVEEFTTETGEKLLVYGAEVDPDDLNNEKQTYKMPNNPLLSNVQKEEDIEDINNLSDDDCEESLEEFWKRAREYLKRNRN